MQVLILLLLACLGPASAWAARPFVTDDARLTTDASCQLESWVRRYRDSREFWLLPACNPFGNLEITAGGGQASSRDIGRTRDYVFQAKTLFRPLVSNDWGWGLAVGTIRHPEINPGPNLLGNTYVYLPFSLSLAEDQLILHANLGWLRDRASGQHSTSWGVGAEFKLQQRWLLIGENFGNDRDRPYWQVGARFAIVPDKVQVDASLGNQYGEGRNARWISFGLRLTPDQLF